MGSLSSVVSMIPGMNSNVIGKDQEKFAVGRIKKFLCMMDSMTEEELDSTKPLSESWIRRVAIGSGSTLEEVSQLIDEHKRFSSMIGKMSDKKMGGPNDMKEM